MIILICINGKFADALVYAKTVEELSERYHEAVDRYIEFRNNIDFGEDIVVLGC